MQQARPKEQAQQATPAPMDSQAQHRDGRQGADSGPIPDRSRNTPLRARLRAMVATGPVLRSTALRDLQLEGWTAAEIREAAKADR